MSDDEEDSGIREDAADFAARLEDQLAPDRWLEAVELGKATGLTDDTCQGRCADLRDWFTYECRGLMDDGEAHNVLDMLLNRLAADASMPERGKTE